MRLILNNCTDPYFNLALEEFLMQHTEDEYFILWRNSPCVIIGRNQDALLEINSEYTEKNNIPVIRRQSGGGAVYHDLGNINYTFMLNDTTNFNNYSVFCQPILEVLHSLGINADLSRRNDLLIDGKKFSGNAQCTYKNRMLHHGTLLFYSDINALTNSLNAYTVKLKNRGIQSARSRVTNIAEHLEESISIDDFCNKIVQQIFNDAGNNIYELTDSDLDKINEIKEKKYLTHKWNYGLNCNYTVSKQSSFSQGTFDIRITVHKNQIKDIHIFGDFFSQKDVKDFEKQLIGIKYSEEAIKEIISQIDIENYFCGISGDQLLSALL